MPINHNRARTLFERYFGSDWIQSIPAKWRAGLRYFIDKTPGVPNDTPPDDVDPPLTPGGVVSSQVTTNRINELELQTTRLDADLLTGAIAHGQDYDDTYDVVIPTTEYLTPDNAEVGQPRRRINPLNPQLSEVQTFDPSALAAVFDTYVLSFPGTASLQLPDVLEGVSCSMETNEADGSWIETGGAFWVNAGSAAMSFGGSAEGAAVVMPSLAVSIRQPFAHNIPTQHHLFFMLLPVTTASVIAKLTALLGVTVLPWPKFKPRIETISLIGQERRVNARVTSHWQDGGGCTSCGAEEGETNPTVEHSEGTGSGISHSLGITIRTVTIPPTIHGAVSITGSLSGSTSGTASASIGSGTVIPVSITDTVTALASVIGSITATDDDNVIPTSGLRILSVSAEPYRFGYAKIHTEVVDFAGL